MLLVDTSIYHYKSRRRGQAPLEQRIKEICQTRVRYGYRRVHVLLRRGGWCHGQNKARRIYRELGLQLLNKTPKRRVKAKLRDDRRPATRSNETWAMDFVHDQLATGRKLRVSLAGIQGSTSSWKVTPLKTSWRRSALWPRRRRCADLRASAANARRSLSIYRANEW